MNFEIDSLKSAVQRTRSDCNPRVPQAGPLLKH
jgi:hypothetical protein